MKKLWLSLALLGLLTGCGAQESYETVADVPVQPVSAAMQQILLDLPEDVAAPVLETPEGGALYVCDGYELWVQTLPGGDMARTVKAVSGFAPEDLTVLEQQAEGVKRYDFAWTSAGEQGARIGRAAVLDDGNYHYVLTAMCDALDAGELRGAWDTAFQSLSLD